MDPVIHGTGEGRMNTAFGFDRWLRVGRGEHSATFSLFEEHVPAGSGPPLHIHHAEQELFTVIEGRVLFHCDGTEAEAGPGTTVLIPTGAPHTFKAVTDAKLLIMFTGSGYGLFDEVAVEGLHPPADMPRIVQIAKTYNTEFVGPPL